MNRTEFSMPPQPLVSVITPSLNSGQFLEDTIQSVLSQDYPHIEYIVMDGGSTDQTIGILERYKHRLRYRSAPDKGAADAINRGFGESRGSILAWLGADDLYLPGAIRTAVESLTAAPNAAVIYGEGYWADEAGRPMRRYPTAERYDASMFSRECCICQPACFMRRQAVEAVGLLDNSLQSAFDYDLWIRLSRQYEFQPVQQCLAWSRMHPHNKSLGEKQTMFEECIHLLLRHYGYVPVNWVYGYVQFLRERSDQFYSPLTLSVRAYLHTLVRGSQYNRWHLIRFWGEWLSRITGKNVARFAAGERALYPAGPGRP